MNALKFGITVFILSKVNRIPIIKERIKQARKRNLLKEKDFPPLTKDLLMIGIGEVHQNRKEVGSYEPKNRDNTFISL